MARTCKLTLVNMYIINKLYACMKAQEQQIQWDELMSDCDYYEK